MNETTYLLVEIAKTCWYYLLDISWYRKYARATAKVVKKETYRRKIDNGVSSDINDKSHSYSIVVEYTNHSGETVQNEIFLKYAVWNKLSLNQTINIRYKNVFSDVHFAHLHPSALL